MQRLITLMSLAIVLFACTQLHGAPVFFGDRASFDAATGGGLSFESFETPFSSSSSVSFSGFSLTETGGTNAIYSFDSGSAATFGISNAATDGNRIAAAANQAGSLFTFQFNSPINAFGIDLTTDNPSSIVVGGDISSSFSTVQNTAQFFGVFDSLGSFDTVTFDLGGGFRGDLGYDAVSFGTAAVPEPATFCIWSMLGGLGLITVRRRRKKLT